MLHNNNDPKFRWHERLITVVTVGTAVLFSSPKAWCEQPSSNASRPSAKAAGKDLIQDVIVTGNHQVPLQKIMACIRSRLGTMYDRFQMEEDVRRLIERRLIRTINVRKEGGAPGPVKLRFIVSEYPAYIREIVYKNAHHMKPEELEELTGIGTAMIPAWNHQLCEIIREHYKVQGRLWATVTLDEGGHPEDTRVVFRIKEGPRARVQRNNFRGNRSFTDQQLNKSVGAFPGFNAKAADMSKERLRQWYRAHGFADVKIECRVKKERNCGSVSLLFSIEEGPRYRVGDIHIQGGEKTDPKTLRQLVPVRLGEYYSERKARQGEKEIQKAICHSQKASVVVRMDWFRRKTKNPDRDLVLVYNITEKNPPVRIGKIIIKGNKTTTDQAILRQLRLRPGGIISARKLSIAEQKLRQLFPHGTMEVRFNLELRQFDFESQHASGPLSIGAVDLFITVQEKEADPGLGVIID
jgi:outer membrane protein insertion porin family